MHFAQGMDFKLESSVKRRWFGRVIGRRRSRSRSQKVRSSSSEFQLLIWWAKMQTASFLNEENMSVLKLLAWEERESSYDSWQCKDFRVVSDKEKVNGSSSKARVKLWLVAKWI